MDEVSEEVKSRLQKTMTMHLEKGLSVFDIVHCVTHAILKCQTEKKQQLRDKMFVHFFQRTIAKKQSKIYHFQKQVLRL